MPSWRAYITSWVIWALYYRRKRFSEEQLLWSLRDNWRDEIEKEVVPVAVRSVVDVSEETYEGKGEGAQEWRVFHLSPKGSGSGETEKMVIYWHGGAFFNGSAPQHWGVVQRLAAEYHLPVVFPQYTLAPRGTADAWCLNALQFTLGVATDVRYKGKTIVHMGDSAGGWMSLRIQQLMMGIELDEEKGYEAIKARVVALKKRTGPSILISPVVNFEITDKLLAKDAEDPWLSLNLLKAMRRIWVRGPAAVPEIDFDLPSDHSSIVPQNADQSDKLYADPRYSLNNGLDIFARYHAKFPEARPFRLLTMIGTYDLCHVGCEEMQAGLEKLGSEVVKADYIEEQGLNHVYPILLNLPEAATAWEKISEVLRE